MIKRKKYHFNSVNTSPNINKIKNNLKINSPKINLPSNNLNKNKNFQNKEKSNLILELYNKNKPISNISYISQEYLNKSNKNENQTSKDGDMRFLETIKIISDIQKKFEESIKENIKPIDEVKKLINNNLNINNYLPLSKKQKEKIEKDIDKSSILRIQNYDTVFNFMQNSLNEIQNFLRNIISTKKKK